ncbi:zinc transporter ZupT [bacterium]|nr:zinc transporter ZupT [bacterium]
MSTNSILFALTLTMFAGLSTGIGSLIALFAKKTNTTFLSVSLGFSAGVMIYVSMIEIFPKAKESLEGYCSSPGMAHFYTILAFFFGMGIIALIDKLVPEYENPHEIKSVEAMVPKNRDKNLMRMGMMSALAIAIHNFPEGIATFTAALKDPYLGIGITIAIAIHNIPEGIAVSVPIYYATGSRKKAFWYSFLSGLSEPVGAILAFLVLMPFLNDLVFGLIFASVAGIMVFISFDELLPTSEKYGKHHLSIYGLIAGMMVMAISLVLFE